MKFISYLFVNKEINFKRLFQTGGMPSSHSSFVMGMTTSVGLISGFNSVDFAVAISLSLVLVVVTEMFIGTDAGLGKRIIDAQLVYQTADMYAAIIMTGILGFLLNKIAMFVENRVVHWKGK